MSSYAYNKTIWTKEMDDKLLYLISKGANAITLENQLKKSKDTIRVRIKEMGFEGLIDARRVMMDAGE